MDRIHTPDDLKVIDNIFLPGLGFSAMMLFARIFSRKYWSKTLKKFVKRILWAYVRQHEHIHHLQAGDFKTEKEKQAEEQTGKEVIFRPYMRYYWKYLLQWIKYGYRNCPFEREAYDFQGVPGYYLTRQPKAWKIYLEEQPATRAGGDPILEMMRLKTEEFKSRAKAVECESCARGYYYEI